MNPVRIEQEIIRLSERLEKATDDLATATQAAANARVAHKRAEARAIIEEIRKTEGRKQTVDVREAWVTMATENELLAKELAEASESSLTEACRTFRAQLSALQTLAANVRGLST